MDLAQEEGPTQTNNGYVLNSQYGQLRGQYMTSGITYKSNQILHKISQIKGYPYALLADIVKLFHMNQFQVIFFCHILNDEECSYQADPAIFESSMSMPDLTKIYNRLTNNGETPLRMRRPNIKVQVDEDDEQLIQGSEENQNMEYWTLKQLRSLYIYLLVIGYSVKYYLNQSTKAYEDEMKRKYPDFFTSIFNVWVDKYSNKVLRTNPRKINQFYIELFMSEENTAIDNSQLDCQYRNYNQIVEELIKATSDADEGAHEEDRDFGTDN